MDIHGNAFLCRLGPDNRRRALFHSMIEELAPNAKLTEERVTQLCALIETTGCTLKAAAAKTGLSPWTLYDWLSRGRQEASGPYREVLDRIEAAR